MTRFSLDEALLDRIFEQAKPLGHNEEKKDLNIGFGFLYYSLVRILQPEHVVVIGSGYGFSVVCLALGLKDNRGGSLSFVDPSYHLLKDGPFQTIGGKGRWSSEDKVRAHFDGFGVSEYVRHFKMTSHEFFSEYSGRDLPPIDLAFIDGNHSLKHVQNDFFNVLLNTRKKGYILLHDTNIYLRELLRHSGVKRCLKSIKKQKDCFEVLDFPFSSGLAIVRVLEGVICQPTRRLAHVLFS